MASRISFGAIQPHRPQKDAWFFTALGVLGGFYALVIVALLAADVAYMVTSVPEGAARSTHTIQDHPFRTRFLDNPICAAMAKPEIRYAVVLSLLGLLRRINL
jgi:hypothetical protein